MNNYYLNFVIIRWVYIVEYPISPMTEKKVIAKISYDGRQKRITVPKQKETEDWEQGDIVKLERVVV